MDVEKTLEFLLHHQASFAAGMEELKGVVAQLAGEVRELKGTVTQLTGVVAEQQKHISQLIAVSGQLVQGQALLTESQQRTDDRLNAVMKMVDDLVRRNGGRSGPPS